MINTEDLMNARLQMHQAVQLLAAAGISFVEKQADDSHTNMAWNSDLQIFASSPFGDQDKFSLGINLAELKYQLLEDNKLLSEFFLNDRTEKEAIEWFKKNLEIKGFDISSFVLDKHYEIPVTEQAQGKPYSLFEKQTFKSLSNHFDMANKVLSAVAGNHKNVSLIRCWPHHFDLGMLLTLRENEDPEKMKSIGLGLSPGDGSYNQPYYYISPWPYPDKNKLNDSDLPQEGFWHSKGFTSTILLAESYLKYADMEKSLTDFLSAAIQINKRLII